MSVSDILSMRVAPKPPKRARQYPVGPSFMSIPEFVKRSTLSRATVYNMINRGELPTTKRLTTRRVGWDRDVIEAWFQSRS